MESTIAAGERDFEGYEIQELRLTIDALDFFEISAPEGPFRETHAVTIAIVGSRKVATETGGWSTLKQNYR